MKQEGNLNYIDAVLIFITTIVGLAIGFWIGRTFL